MNRVNPMLVTVLFLSLVLASTAHAKTRESRYKQLAVDDFRIDESLERPWVMKVAGFCTLRFAVRSAEQDGRAARESPAGRFPPDFTARNQSGFTPESGMPRPRKWRGRSRTSRATSTSTRHTRISSVQASRALSATGTRQALPRPI